MGKMLLSLVAAAAASDCARSRVNPCAGHELEFQCVLGAFPRSEALDVRRRLDAHPSAARRKRDVSFVRAKDGHVVAAHNQTNVAFLRPAWPPRTGQRGDALHAALAGRLLSVAAEANRAGGWNYSLALGVNESPERLQSVTYEAPGGFYGRHIDVAPHKDSTLHTWRQRALSVLVQLADRGEDYAGGELVVETRAGRSVTAPGCAGDAIVFPSDAVWHAVRHVSAGRRRVLVYWVWHASEATRVTRAAARSPQRRPVRSSG
mmetsp:Transcript_9008/g.27007  ORF Transcript_9008/g.27007 Transcript_9008/m.27007 type:complete len:262 (-) Transcript_9008:25-810(-)